ncbi:toxin-antitoxin system, antitoxin component, PHD family [Desulfosarcina variabilis str. Montpellier]|uniref:type II toxin-antitoxin system Phd/YefM family antitoxin n=1 Tax=Desulfosarcina variabilis TaxID=2300 RepID=UPI003AFA02D0
MQIDTERIISVARLQKELTAKLREVTDREEPLFVMRNNTLAAVVISPAEYELLRDADEVLDHFEIADMIEKRLKDHDPSRNVSWDTIKAKHGI